MGCSGAVIPKHCTPYTVYPEPSIQIPNSMVPYLCLRRPGRAREEGHAPIPLSLAQSPLPYVHSPISLAPSLSLSVPISTPPSLSLSLSVSLCLSPHPHVSLSLSLAQSLLPHSPPLSLSFLSLPVPATPWTRTPVKKATPPSMVTSVSPESVDAASTCESKWVKI